MQSSARLFLVMLPLVVSACGWAPFVEPKANPIIEDRVGAFRTMATTGERRIAFVRIEPLDLKALSDRQQQNAEKDLTTRELAIKREADDCAKDKDKNKNCERRGGHEFFARRLIGQFGGKAGEFCAEPSPDSIESLATAFTATASGSVSASAGVSKELQAALAKSLATNAASVFRRTQGVQLYRDGAFFLCQAMMNGYIDAAEYQEALFKLRSDAKDLIMKEFETQAWKTDPYFISVPTPPLPKNENPGTDPKKGGTDKPGGDAAVKKP